jgi:hypothetical protein
LSKGERNARLLVFLVVIKFQLIVLRLIIVALVELVVVRRLRARVEFQLVEFPFVELQFIEFQLVVPGGPDDGVIFQRVVVGRRGEGARSRLG